MAKQGSRGQAGRGGEEEAIVELTESLVEQARRELSRERWITPYKVASRYGIKVSLAKKLLKRLEEEGVLVLFSKSRRSSIYVPRERAPVAPPRSI